MTLRFEEFGFLFSKYSLIVISSPPVGVVNGQDDGQQ